MNKALSFIWLDFITVKPYFTLKNLFIFIALSLFFTIDSNTGAAANGMLMVFASLYISYPFAVGERNGIDTLYPTLSIKRSSVVLGRYLFTLTLDICVGIISFAYSFITMTILHKAFNASEALATILALFIVFTIVQAMQLPIYFKLGYTKAKMLAYLPFIVFTFVILMLKNFFGDGLMSLVAGIAEWITTNAIMASAFAIIIWLGIMVISFQTSLVFYNKRDF